MKILITGSSGFVGSHLKDRLTKRNHKVIPYDLKSGEDILGEKSLRNHMRGVDVVVHLAALVSQWESWERPRDYFLTNGIGTYNVLDAAIKNGVPRLIHISSAAVYDPDTPYGASKKWGEDICTLHKSQIEAIILRPFNIYGPGQNPAYGYAIHNFIKGIKEKGEVEIYGSGKQRRDYIYIDDVVRVLEFSLTANLPGNPLDLGTGNDIEVIKLAELLGKILNKSFTIKFSPPRKEPFALSADLKNLKTWGVDPKKFFSLEEGLTKLLQTYSRS